MIILKVIVVMILIIPSSEESKIVFINDKPIEFCLRWTLRKGEYSNILTDANKIKWITMDNQTMDIDIRDDYGNPAICAPFKLKKEEKNCWTFYAYKWSYKMFHDSVELHLGSFSQTYNSSQYELLPNSSIVAIKCFTGVFTSNCSSKFKGLKFSLSDIKYFDKMTFEMFNSILNSSYFTSDAMNRTRMCFNTTGYSDPCKERFILYNGTFKIYKNRTLFAEYYNKYYKPGEYEIFDGSAIVSHCGIDIVATASIHNDPQAIITGVGIGISLVCLFLHIIVSVTFGDHRTFPGRILLSLVAALFCAQFLFVLRMVAVYHSDFCKVVGILLHYFFLANFCWMGIIAFNMWRMLHSTKMQILSKQEEKRRFIIYSLGGWISPLLIILPACLSHKYANDSDYNELYGTDLCWITKRYPLIIFFVVPLGIILIANIFFFSVTSWSICKAAKSSKLIHKPGEERSRFAIYWKLAVIMGLGWIFFLLSIFTGWTAFVYIFILLNAPQGFFIFLGFTCIKKVREKTRQGIENHLSLRKSNTPSLSSKITITKNSIETARSLETLTDSKI